MPPSEPSSNSDRDWNRMKRDAWSVEPAKIVTFAVGGHYRCPDERCGQDDVPMRVPHPKDETKTANRCPTCLATAVEVRP